MSVCVSGDWVKQVGPQGVHTDLNVADVTANDGLYVFRRVVGESHLATTSFTSITSRIGFDAIVCVQT